MTTHDTSQSTVDPEAQMRIGALREAVIGVFAQACCQHLTVRDIVDAAVFDGFDYAIFPACRSVTIDPAKLDRRHMLTKRRLTELVADEMLTKEELGDGEVAWRVVPGAIDQLPPVDPDHVCATTDAERRDDTPGTGEKGAEPDPVTATPWIDNRGPLRPVRDVRADIAAVAVPMVSRQAVAAVAAHRRAVTRRRRLAVFTVLAVATVILLVATMLTA